MKIYDYDGKKNISGDRIRQARVVQRMRQEDLAAKLQIAGVNMERDSISRIEIGTRFVSDFELKVFAKVLGVSVLWPVFSRKGLDIIRQMQYNIITGKGKPSKRRKENTPPERGCKNDRRANKRIA